jgi:hypothetical protein
MSVRALALAALVLAACDDSPSTPEQPETITDQSGAVFGWKCDDKRCYVERLDESPPLPDCGPEGKAFYSYTWGGIIEITGGCPGSGDGSWGALGSWGRFVVCEADADCPAIVDDGAVDGYLCHAGYCRSVASAEYHDELPNKWMMEMLCFGDRPRFEGFDDPALYAASEAACPGDSINSPCDSIPEGCPDPRR